MCSIVQESETGCHGKTHTCSAVLSVLRKTPEINKNCTLTPQNL